MVTKKIPNIIGKCKLTFKRKFNRYFHDMKIINVILKEKFIIDASTFMNNLTKVNNNFHDVVKVINSISEQNNKCILPSLFIAIFNNNKIKPFWTKKTKTISDKLFLPSIYNVKPINNSKNKTGLDIQEYKNKNDKKYKLKHKQIDKKVKEIIKCKKIKLYFNKEQNDVMQITMATYRYYYNRTIAYFKNINYIDKTSWFYINTKDKIKHDVTLSGNYFKFENVRKLIKEPQPSWILDGYPSHLIDMAIREACKNMSTCKNSKKIFNLKFKSKSDINYTMNLEASMVNQTIKPGASIVKQNNLFTNWELNNKYLFRNIKTSQHFMKNNLGSTITYHSVLKEYYLNVTYKTDSTPTKINNICAIDPGIRTPLTVFSQNKIVNIGNNMKDKMLKVCKEIDIIQSRINSKEYMDNSNIGKYTVTNQRKKRLRRAMHKKIQYLKNIKTEFHNKTIKYLCNNYSTIIFPPFETQEMASKLNSKVARQMYNLSFYELRIRLRNKCDELHIKLLENPEAYTSMTCTNCGNLKCDLGSSKIYNCKKCKLTIDRDLNGARNILLKNIFFI